MNRVILISFILLFCQSIGFATNHSVAPEPLPRAPEPPPPSWSHGKIDIVESFSNKIQVRWNGPNTQHCVSDDVVFTKRSVGGEGAFDRAFDVASRSLERRKAIRFKLNGCENGLQIAEVVQLCANAHDANCHDEPKPLITLKGDAGCEFGAVDCNHCVNDVPKAFDGLQKDVAKAGRIRFDGYAYPKPKNDYLLHRISRTRYRGYSTREHIQGIGRIAGVGNNEYMVFTHSTDSKEDFKEGALAVVRMGANQNTGGGPFLDMYDGDGPDQNTSNRVRNIRDTLISFPDFFASDLSGFFISKHSFLTHN